MQMLTACQLVLMTIKTSIGNANFFKIIKEINKVSNYVDQELIDQMETTSETKNMSLNFEV